MFAENTDTLTLIERALSPRLDRPGTSPFVLGICGAQGCGKSFVAAKLKEHFEHRGKRVAILSLDDLYLPRSAREALAASVHPLFLTRGVPGTHDVAQGLTLFETLGAGLPVRLPRFDKANDEPFPESEWETVGVPLDLLLFEGWCVGAAPQSKADLQAPVNALESERDPDGIWRRHVNAMLDGDYRRLFAWIDMQVLLAAPDFGVVAGWRTEQEEALKRRLEIGGEDAGKGIMTADQIRWFVQHYERLTRAILADMPKRADLTIRLDEKRKVAGWLRGLV